MGVFDELADAMSGKAAPTNKTLPAQGGGVNLEGQSFDKLRAGRDYAASHGIRPTAGDHNAVSGVDSAMAKHADQVHPVK